MGQTQELLRTRIVDIEPIEQCRNTTIRQKSDLVGLVEPPLLSACEELYDKNVPTLASSANKKDIEYIDYKGEAQPNDGAYIVIDFDSLSEANKNISAALGAVYYADEGNQIKITIPLTTESTFGDVRSSAVEIAHKFEKQKFSPVTYTLDQMRKIYYSETLRPEDLADELYWVPELELFFLSREQYEKATAEKAEEDSTI